MPLTPTQKLKREILLLSGQLPLDDLQTAGDIEEAYEALKAIGEHYEAQENIRCMGEDTHLPRPYDRNYESKAVALKTVDGSWVGWTYWHGGGKFGEPGNIPWMETAYDLNCEERQQTVTVRTFALKE